MATPARRAALRRHLRAPPDPDYGGPSAPNFGACEARASSVADLGAPQSAPYLMHAGNDANRVDKESSDLQELCRAL
jgi:hypothetical protein